MVYARVRGLSIRNPAREFREALALARGVRQRSRMGGPAVIENLTPPLALESSNRSDPDGAFTLGRWQ